MIVLFRVCSENENVLNLKSVNWVLGIKIIILELIISLVNERFYIFKIKIVLRLFFLVRFG